MKKRITLLFALLAALVTTAMADNVISAEAFTIAQSGNADLTINLTNTDEIRGIQFTLTFPAEVTLIGSDAEITYVDGATNKGYAPEHGVQVSTTDRTKNWWVLGNNVPTTGNPNTYKFVMLDPLGDGLAASTTGAESILKIRFKVANNAQAKNYNVSISDIHISISSEEGLADVAQATEEPISLTSLSVSNFIKGDVNGNGIFEIGDAVCILRQLAQKSNIVFVEAAADVNDNNNLDIGDAVLVLQYLAGKIDNLSRGIVNDSDWDLNDPD